MPDGDTQRPAGAKPHANSAAAGTVNAVHETETADGLTIRQLLARTWQSDLPEDGLPERFTEPGWTYQEQVPRPCPDCESPLHSLRRPYESAGRQYRYTALVCPACPRAFTLADLGVKTYDKLLQDTPARTRPAGRPKATPAPRRAPEAAWGRLLPFPAAPCPAPHPTRPDRHPAPAATPGRRGTGRHPRPGMARRPAASRAARDTRPVVGQTHRPRPRAPRTPAALLRGRTRHHPGGGGVRPAACASDRTRHPGAHRGTLGGGRGGDHPLRSGRPDRPDRLARRCGDPVGGASRIRGP
ncbi:hypothetical protein GCM10010195_72710 [Kitasatospora griseola]|nr:hypothetical protein GCM10010195_72710 [Kitasatospora griseola]